MYFPAPARIGVLGIEAIAAARSCFWGRIATGKRSLELEGDITGNVYTWYLPYSPFMTGMQGALFALIIP